MLLPIALFAVAAGAFAQETVGGVTPAANSDGNPWAKAKGPVKGRVVDPSGRPVAGARVVWLAAPVNFSSVQNTATRVVGERKTGPDGRFVFQDANQLAPKGSARVVAFTPVGIAVAAEGQVRPNADLTLNIALQSKLVLRFLDTNGKPAANLGVQANLMVPASRQSWVLPLNDGRPLRTDAAGTLTFPALPAAHRVRLRLAPGTRFAILPPADEALVLRRPTTTPPPIRLAPGAGR